MGMFQTFVRQETVTKKKRRITHTKKHTQKRRNFFFLSRRRWQPRRNREDVERLAAEFLAICDAFFCFFLSFCCREFCEQNEKSRQSLNIKLKICIFFYINVRFLELNNFFPVRLFCEQNFLNWCEI